jgi:cell division protein FtsI (penicillin-binding protein 3)
MDSVEMLRGIPEQYLERVIDEDAERISQALDLSVDDVKEKIGRKRRFLWLKRRVSESEVNAVKALSDTDQRKPLRGLTIEGEGRRFYPNRELGGPLIGFVSPDGDGREGLELSLNEELRGKPAEVHGLRDRDGRLIFSEGLDDEQALAGHNVYLTIDKAIQFEAERELASALKTYEAKGGSVIVMDPNSGEILAMASAPGYNPNDYNASDPADRRNRAVVDRFEPGSTMKIFTFSTAFAAKSSSPTEPIYCEEGRMPIDNVVIHDTHIMKWLTPTQCLQYSSNICAAKIALGLGQERLYDGFRRFGFGESAGLPLPGQSIGVLRPRDRPWVQVETASAAFGQGISVTSIQLATAVSAIANHGRLFEPALIKQVTDSTGAVLETPTARVRRIAVGPQTAKLMSEMLVSVTEGEGTGVEASIPGFRVAGKTATAQKIDPETGKYSERYIASFVGFVPADKPRLTVVVVIDEPMAGTYAGGSVAAPVFRRVGEMALQYLGVTPNGADQPKLTEVAAAAKGADPAEAAYQAVVEAKGGTVPGPHTVMPPARKPKSNEALVPDLTGYPVRDAIRALVERGLVPHVEGTGVVLRQDPAANSIVPTGGSIQLSLEPPT